MYEAECGDQKEGNQRDRDSIGPAGGRVGGGGKLRAAGRGRPGRQGLYVGPRDTGLVWGGRSQGG